MTNRVVSNSEVSLNGVLLPISGTVEPVPLNVYPEKEVIGDYTRESNPTLSSVAWSDFRGGIGLDIMEGSETDRAWTSTLNIRYHRSIVLASLLTETDSCQPTGPFNHAVDFEESVYGAWNQDIYKYNSCCSTWGNSLYDSGACGVLTDSINVRLADTDYVIFADCGNSQYVYSCNGTCWSTACKSVNKMAFWDNRLWGIDACGQMWYAFTPGTETCVAKLPVTPGASANCTEISAMFTGPDATGEQILYVATTFGLYAYDTSNDRFILTDLQVAKSRFNGLGSTTWRNRIYYPLGSGLLEYDPVNRTILSVGLDQDDGLPARTGHINHIEPSNNELYVGLSRIFPCDGSVFAWNRRGWYELYDAGSQVDTLHVSSADNEYRLFIGTDPNEAFYVCLPVDLPNPKYDTTANYAACGSLKTPWFHADQTDVDKLAVRVKTEVADVNACETVRISYATDYDDCNFTSYAAITNNGITTRPFHEFGAYLCFDGCNDSVTVCDAAAIQDLPTTALSGEAWIYPESCGFVNNGRIMNKSPGGCAGWAFTVTCSNNGRSKLAFRVEFANSDALYLTKERAIRLDAWNHAAFTFDGCTALFYVCGESLCVSNPEAACGAYGSDACEPLRFGNGLSCTFPFKGRIDEVRLWSDIRTACEIKDNYLCQIDPCSACLVGYWRFNDGTGTTATDSTANGNNGTISGATWKWWADCEPSGKAFRSIRFKADLARGCTTTKSPRLVSITLEHRKKLPFKNGFRFFVDLRGREYKGRTNRQLWDALLTALESERLVEFSYRDDPSGTSNYFVDVFADTGGARETGLNYQGVLPVLVVER